MTSWINKNLGMYNCAHPKQEYNKKEANSGNVSVNCENLFMKHISFHCSQGKLPRLLPNGPVQITAR